MKSTPLYAGNEEDLQAIGWAGCKNATEKQDGMVSREILSHRSMPPAPPFSN